MLVKCFGEFMGTLVLILLGDGVVAGVLLKRSKAEGAGWMVITSGWAFAVMAGVFTAIACGSNDAYLNPAVTMGFAVSSGQFAKLAPYIVAQMAGAFVGATLVWLHFLPHWKETPDQGLKLAVFCTAPAIRKFGANLISGTGAGSRPLPGCCTGLGHRTFARRNHWLRNQSRARSWAASRSRGSSHRG
jgi:glycerol uptake facilitator protein